MSSCLYVGKVMHERFQKVAYHFRYQTNSIKVDVDTIQAESAQTKGLSLNRWNLFSVNFKDHGARDGGDWRQWCETFLQSYGITVPLHKIELVCFPRFLGYSFNPLAMWYVYNTENQLIAVIGEVSNTFGQWHHYVLANGGKPIKERVKAQAKKVFHVSPFLGMDCEYFFTLKQPSETYQVRIDETENGQPKLLAVQVGQRQKLNGINLLKAALKLPFNTLWIMWLIHWWALKIWLKGGRFHSTPKHLSNVKYGHTRMELC